MDFLLGLLCGALLTHAFAALYFPILFRGRPQQGYFGLYAVHSLLLAVHIGLRVAFPLVLGEVTRDVLARVGWASFFAALAVLVHFALRYVRAEDMRRWLLVTYVVAFAFSLFGLTGALVAGPASQPPIALVYPLTGNAGLGAVPPLAVVVHIGSVAAVTIVLVLFARAYLNGRRELLPVIFGTTLLLAAVLHDGGLLRGSFGSLYLADLGFVPLSLGVRAVVGIRYARVLTELDKKSIELKTRTRELRKSYEELRTAQEELVKKEQLAVVGELAAVIAHEVRNPLAIIGNAVAGLRKASLSREDQSTLLSILDEETSRLNRLVTDLLRYARPVNVQRQHVVLTDLLERGLSLARDKKRTKVDVEVETDDLRLWGDANLLRQVFDNLIDNAVQAMSAGGQLTVRVRAARPDEGESAGLAVEIADTGEGMDTQVRSRAKDPFFTTRPSGTGLGLAIVDRIVDAHGGRLLIASRPGEGTTVTVVLPVGSPDGPMVARALAPSPPRHEARRSVPDPALLLTDEPGEDSR